MGKNNRAFTVIELLLVIAIILLILMLTVPALMTVKRKALVLSCQSNMHQIDLMIKTYCLSNDDDVIPYLFYAAEGMLDPEHMNDPETNVSGLATIVREEDRGILRCPADNGYGGVDYGLISGDVACYACFGQSYVYNNSAYTDSDFPYPPPPRFGQIATKDQERIIMLTDFSSVWHGAPGTDKKNPKYFLNIMYFSGSVEGKEFSSDLAAKRFRNDEQQRRWW